MKNKAKQQWKRWGASEREKKRDGCEANAHHVFIPDNLNRRISSSYMLRTKKKSNKRIHEAWNKFFANTIIYIRWSCIAMVQLVHKGRPRSPLYRSMEQSFSLSFPLFFHFILLSYSNLQYHILGGRACQHTLAQCIILHGFLCSFTVFAFCISRLACYSASIHFGSKFCTYIYVCVQCACGLCSAFGSLKVGQRRCGFQCKKDLSFQTICVL